MNHLNKLCDFLGNAVIHSYKVLATRKPKKLPKKIELPIEPQEDNYYLSDINQDIKPVELNNYLKTGPMNIIEGNEKPKPVFETPQYIISTKVRCGTIEGRIHDIKNTPMGDRYYIIWENDMKCWYDKNWLNSQVEVIDNE